MKNNRKSGGRRSINHLCRGKYQLVEFQSNIQST